ncbi:hypothetical protein RRG08_029884 [Elysia crispata]|uniref:Uncharacterized protein n=1 Tax=Elysia crispata TaxID=231223 RepID=A0AAE0YL82_9GAST|nr:hypothetical protein RRG08_029884 [Elysia crispata]
MSKPSSVPAVCTAYCREDRDGRRNSPPPPHTPHSPLNRASPPLLASLKSILYERSPALHVKLVPVYSNTPSACKDILFTFRMKMEIFVLHVLEIQNLFYD